MADPVDVSALDAETRALADHGSQELFGVPLATLIDNLATVGESLSQDELDGLVLAGRLAETLDARSPAR
jgi:hypothetical protein